jgi:uncharacterized protein (TIGR02271 family)
MQERDDKELIRAEEELEVRTEPARLGFVRVRKHAETEQVESVQERTVEEVDGLEPMPAAVGDSGEVEVLPDGSVSIPVFEERLVVSKQIVVKERVVVRKRSVMQTELVQESLRRERVDVNSENETEVTVENRSYIDDRPALRKAALLVGVVFLVTGIAGFIPGITENAPGDFAGEDSEGSLLGVFQTGVLHNLVHGFFGVLGIVMSRKWQTARTFLIGGGVVYLVLFLVGMLGEMDWLPADDTDDWLHLGLGVGMLALGALLGRAPVRREAARHGREQTVGSRAG